jgi:hypothetical protein
LIGAIERVSKILTANFWGGGFEKNRRFSRSSPQKRRKSVTDTVAGFFPPFFSWFFLNVRCLFIIVSKERFGARVDDLARPLFLSYTTRPSLLTVSTISVYVSVYIYVCTEAIEIICIYTCLDIYTMHTYVPLSVSYSRSACLKVQVSWHVSQSRTIVRKKRGFRGVFGRFPQNGQKWVFYTPQICVMDTLASFFFFLFLLSTNYMYIHIYIYIYIYITVCKCECVW